MTYSFLCTSLSNILVHISPVHHQPDIGIHLIRINFYYQQYRNQVNYNFNLKHFTGFLQIVLLIAVNTEVQILFPHQDECAVTENDAVKRFQKCSELFTIKKPSYGPVRTCLRYLIRRFHWAKLYSVL